MRAIVVVAVLAAVRRDYGPASTGFVFRERRLLTCLRTVSRVKG